MNLFSKRLEARRPISIEDSAIEVPDMRRRGNSEASLVVREDCVGGWVTKDRDGQQVHGRIYARSSVVVAQGSSLYNAVKTVHRSHVNTRIA